jgi:NAD(P)-dependent dehydrogenase (short-subunit alcohol dehydrogenase family)
MAAKPARTIWITGVSRGLGRAMAVAFARRGHRVVGCGRSDSALETLRVALGSDHWIDRVDVADDAGMADWCRKRLIDAGAPDILINNAAVMNPNAPLWNLDAEQFDAVLRVNVSGTVNAIRHLLPSMIEQGRGIVVNLSSGWGRSTSAMVAPYCASKWAIEGLTRSLAQELPEGMAAVALNPGIIDTQMLRSCFGADAAQYPDADEWATRSVPFILGLAPKDNGKPLNVP